MFYVITEIGICEFKDGSAISEKQEHVGKEWLSEDCFNLVKQKHHEANGVSWDPVTEDCYAEFGASTIEIDEVLSSKQSCIFNGKLFSPNIS